MELRKYQNDHLGAARHAIKTGNRKIILQAPTGAGKTIEAAEVARAAINKGNNVLFLVNKRDLVYQCRDRFISFGIGDEVGLIMAGEETDFSRRIMIATIQTYHRRAKLDDPESNFWVHNAQIVIVDEAHSSVCSTYMSVLEIYKKKAVILGLTATPCRADGRGLGRVYDRIVSSADVRELTEQGYLVPMVYYAPDAPDLSKIPIKMNDYAKKELGEAMNKPKLVGDVYTQWFRIAPERPTLIFCVNVKHSLAIKQEFERCGVSIEHVDARTPTDVRQDIYRRFRDGDVQVMTNVGIATEGTDFPWVSCIVIARPTRSFAFYFQMAGRGLRPYPYKEDCILIDHSGCVDAHGFVDDPVEWTLDDKELAWSKKKKREKEKKLMTCKNCMFVFEGSKCPRCGAEVRNYGKLIETTDDDLVRVKGKEKQKKKATKEEKQNFYAMARVYAKRKGYKRGWIAHTYRKRFGVWPRGMSDRKEEPDHKFISFITHLNIKQAHARKKGTYFIDFSKNLCYNGRNN